MEIKKGEPPKTGAKGAYTELIEAAKAEPGEWMYVVITRKQTAIAGHFTRGTVSGVNPGDMDAKTRTVDGERRLYFRWIPEEER